MLQVNTQNNATVNRHYNVFDLIKLIMSLLVIIIHRPLFNEAHISLNYFTGITISGLAVPFFFACTEFLFYNKWVKDPTYTFRYTKRIFILYVLWSAIYLPCCFVKAFTGHYHEITPRLLAGQALIYLRDFFLNTSFVPFWYLTSTILGILLLSLLCKKFALMSVAVFSSLISAALTAMMSVSAWKYALSYIPAIVMNTLRYSLPCLTLGALCAERALERSSKCERVVCIAAIAGYGFVDVVLFCIFGPEISMPIRNVTKLFAAAAIVCLASGFYSLKSSEAFKTMRNLSTLIYCSHLLLMSEGFRWLAFVTGFQALEENQPLRYILTVLFAFTVSFLIMGLSRIKSMRFLKYLY